MRVSGLRRLVYYGLQSSRAFVSKVAMRAPPCRVVPKLFRGGVICAFAAAAAAVPMTAAIHSIGNSKYHDQTFQFPERILW
ncbi:MAG: hypothetical protein Hyperionvirus6_65 [Hyperionvirus sp.]|uniref:Uncharacterized protein n=1 Tax=Hyperionvirus sp. TaxID=2487770 RepID=A0A3G5AA75_9VIRU|nr:MAG: hypothetical protein Hyperionvirus6_65 [Hyperionvirus sp.]